MVLKRSTSFLTGTRLNYLTGVLEPGSATKTDAQLITSINGRDTVHPFSSAHLENKGGLISGQGSYYRFNGWPSGYFPSSPIINGMEHPSATIENLIARTNPSRPGPTMPLVAAYELRDLPEMMENLGEAIADCIREFGSWDKFIRSGVPTSKSPLSGVAGANLAIQFGWLPLVQDLVNLARFQDSVEKRRKQLKKLFSKGQRSRVPFGIIIDPPVSNLIPGVANSDGGAFVATSSIAFLSIKAWGTVRWTLNEDIDLKPSNGEIEKALRGASSPEEILLDIWSVLPWSWLADWFIPIGDVLRAGNRAIASPSAPCIMRERKTAIHWFGYTEGDNTTNPQDPLTLEPGHSVSIQRTRSIGGSVDDYYGGVPILGASQLSILGSLVFARGLASSGSLSRS
jgi:hypothetical protein